MPNQKNKSKKVEGAAQSIRKSLVARLEGLYAARCEKGRFLPEGALALMAEITAASNKEIAVMIDRRGVVQSVSVGDDRTVGLADKDKRRGSARTSGIRCVHTHPNGDPFLSDIDLASLAHLRLDAMASVAVGADGRVLGAQAAIKPVGKDARIFGPYWIGGGGGVLAADAADAAGAADAADAAGAVEAAEAADATDAAGAVEAADAADAVEAVEAADATDAARVVDLESLHEAFDGILPEIYAQERAVKAGTFETTAKTHEKAILVCIGGASASGGEAAALQEELSQLARTAGADVVAAECYRERSPDPAFHIGRGRIDELSLLCQKHGADIVVVDAELTGAQTRNIEDAVGARVVDRTTLILDIFAQRARSREGKLQVELAQLNYRLPRLTGQGTALSRLGGGIGTRGPGERKLDVDRRHIRRRINHIEKELGQVHGRRSQLRRSSGMADAPVVAIVGYTNAGKSTLFNALCGADAFAEDKLFATLDPTARRLDMPSGGSAMVVDTVGFIRNLPHDLVEAFKATLEETAQADVLLHVADASSAELDAQMETVRQILAGISAGAGARRGKKRHGGAGGADGAGGAGGADGADGAGGADSAGRAGRAGGAGDAAARRKTIVALNKVDKLKGGGVAAIAAPGESMCEISALTGEGLGKLREMIAEAVQEGGARVEMLIPYTDGGALAYVRSFGSAVECEFKEEGVLATALLKKEHLGRVGGYIIKPAQQIVHSRKR